MAARTNRFDCTGRADIYYYSPDGRKIRSKPQLARCFGDNLDLGLFDYRTGKLKNIQLPKQMNQRIPQYDYSRGARNDASLVPPIRQTASIFKQPVTVYKTQESKVKTDFKHGILDKPKQLFWEKRLEGLRACITDGHKLRAMELPKGLKAVGPHVTEETLLQSVATALHVSNQPITGQTGSKSSLDKNPGVFINPDQLLVQNEFAVPQGRSVGQQQVQVNKPKESSIIVLTQDEISTPVENTNIAGLFSHKNEFAVPQGRSVGRQQVQVNKPKESSIIDLTQDEISTPVENTNIAGLFSHKNEFAVPQGRSVGRQQVQVNKPKESSIIDLTQDEISTPVENTNIAGLFSHKNEFAIPQGRSVGRQQVQVKTQKECLIIDLTEDSTPLENTNSTGDSTPAEETNISGFFSCQVCDKNFSKLDMFNQHMNTHPKLPAHPYKCILCLSDYQTEQELHRHRIIYHIVTEEVEEEMFVPIVDFKQKGIVKRYKNLGIKDFIPVIPLNEETNGMFGIPVVTTGDAYNSVVCKLRSLGASNVFSIGTAKAIEK